MLYLFIIYLKLYNFCLQIFSLRGAWTRIILRISFKHIDYLHKHRFCFEPDIELQSASVLQ